MNYMGSKRKIATSIVPILQNTIDKNNIETYIEPFCGGCNIIDKIKIKNRLAFDRSDTLIALLQQSVEDFSLIPKDGNREMWDEGKEYVKNGKKIGEMKLYEIGAIEFLGSFSNGGFSRGYAKNSKTRNYYQEAYKNLEKQIPDLKGISFKAQNYWDLENVRNCVIYADPPYANTTTYGYASQGKMNYEHFWNWIRELSRDNYVFVSEQNAPEDFTSIWEKSVKRTVKTNNNFEATEKLFVWKDGKYYE